MMNTCIAENELQYTAEIQCDLLLEHGARQGHMRPVNRLVKKASVNLPKTSRGSYIIDGAEQIRASRTPWTTGR